MAEPATLSKAKLVELDAKFTNPLPGGKQVEVQFNPESLKVSYTTKTEQPASAGDQNGNPPRQVIGAGLTKLALQLWFDVNAPGARGVQDVRELTGGVSYFMIPRRSTVDPKAQPVPPGLSFVWGTFTFAGVMDSLEESLDFFSPDGRPLRASLSLTLSGQMEIAKLAGSPSGTAAAGPTAGTKPLTKAPAGVSLQNLAASAGAAVSWQAIATANGIENPRLLAPGQLLDLNAGLAARF
ncbi:CIS tube protein [Amycolatopsis sp. NPDC054798]